MNVVSSLQVGSLGRRRTPRRAEALGFINHLSDCGGALLVEEIRESWAGLGPPKTCCKERVGKKVLLKLVLTWKCLEFLVVALELEL